MLYLILALTMAYLGHPVEASVLTDAELDKITAGAVVVASNSNTTRQLNTAPGVNFKTTWQRIIRRSSSE